ncbi:MAG: response regulator [Holophaga sp.]|jgi:two-component system cell cycle response regulator
MTSHGASEGKGETRHPQGPGAPGGAGAHILFVDDDAYMRRLMSARLEHLGTEVQAVASAQACLEALEHGRPDLIISDAVMPVMDGFDLCRHVRSNPALRSIPFLILTALTRDLRNRSLQAGADDYLSKLETDAVFRMRARLAFHLGLRLRVRSSGSPPAETASLLVVSDSSTIQSQMATHLQKEGVRIQGAASLGDAARHLGAQPPDLLVLDLALGHKAVLEWATRLRGAQAGMHLPILVLAAKDEDPWLGALEHLIQDRLPKPLDSQESRHRVNLLLRVART